MATAPTAQQTGDLSLTEQFLRYGRYVRNWSPRTVECYRQALRECPATITKASLNATVVAMRERGLSPGGINLRARAINSYLTWLHEDGHVSERLKIKMLRNPPKPIQTLTDKDIHRVAMFRPKGNMPRYNPAKGRPAMRISAGMIVATLLVGASTVSAQWIRYKESGVPRTRDGAVNLTAAVPQLDGKPDLSGVWLAEADPPKALGPFAPPEEFLGEPGFSRYFFNFFFDSPDGQPPFTAAAAAAAREQGRERVKPETACDRPALPQWNLIPAPMKIVQAKRQVVVLYEAGTVFRQIYTDGRPLPDDPNPSRFGYSTARWNADTLVVETIGLNGKRLDAVGHPHSERLSLTERFRRRDYGHMTMQTTVDDPMTYVESVTISVPFKLLPDSDVLEAFCQENEKDLIHIQKAFELDQIRAKPQP